MANEVVEGQLGGGLPHLSFGHGPPLVVFPGLGMTNANPTGIQRWGELRLLSPLARSFTVHRVGRKVGLKRGTIMADLAQDYAGAVKVPGVRFYACYGRRDKTLVISLKGETYDRLITEVDDPAKVAETINDAVGALTRS